MSNKNEFYKVEEVFNCSNYKYIRRKLLIKESGKTKRGD